ncbi:MAG: YdcF family protein, partial [Gemmatimonadales bacterium]|nr:YdcF family protein [Gemmatimonadales bacterium]
VVVSRQDQRRPVGAIVVLGAAQYNGRPSPVLEARLRHALELYRAGLAPIMVVTGGIGRGDRESEATVGRRWLLEQGVGAAAVLVRPEGSNTAASIVAVADWAEGFQITSVLLVSDPFHTARLRQESRRAGLRGWTSPTRTSPISASLRIELPYLLAESWKAPAAWLGWGR